MNLSNQKFGKWKLLRPLHPDSQPTIRQSYVATDLETDASVAITVLEETYEGNEELIEEIRFGVAAYKSLEISPGLLDNVDCQSANGKFLVANQYLPRATLLSRWLSKGYVFSEDEIVHIGEQISHALVTAQSAGVVFGHITPGFILYDPNDKQAYISTLPLRIPESKSLLAIARAVGVPYYRPPEFFTDNETHSSSVDVYALFMSLFTLCTGKHAYDETSDFGAACMAVVNKPIPEIQDDTGASKRLRTLIQKGLVKERSKRLSSAVEVRKHFLALKPLNTPVISPARLRDTVLQHYPYPISHQYRLISDEDLDPAFRVKQLEVGLIAILEFFGAVIVPLTRKADGIEEPESFSQLVRPTMGQWLRCIRDGANALQSQANTKWFEDIVSLFAHNTSRGRKAHSLFDQLVQWRNGVAHGIQTDLPSILGLLKSGLELYLQMCRQLTFLTRYTLIYVTGLQFRDRQFATSIIRFSGTTPRVEELVLDVPLPSDHVLLVDNTFCHYTELSPYIRYASCPIEGCDVDDLFLYQSVQNGKQHFLSLHRGHGFDE
jgi:serine/threonine protein kinase